MATVDAQVLDANGVTVSFAACTAGGDKVVAGDGVVLLFKNDHGSNDYTVTLNDPTSTGPGAAKQFDPDVAVVVTHGTVAAVPVPRRFADVADAGKCAFTYSATPTTMSVGVIRS